MSCCMMSYCMSCYMTSYCMSCCMTSYCMSLCMISLSCCIYVMTYCTIICHIVWCHVAWCHVSFLVRCHVVWFHGVCLILSYMRHVVCVMLFYVTLFFGDVFTYQYMMIDFSFQEVEQTVPNDNEIVEVSKVIVVKKKKIIYIYRNRAVNKHCSMTFQEVKSSFALQFSRWLTSFFFLHISRLLTS